MSTAVMWLLLFVVVALGILIAALSKTKFTTKKIATIGIMAALSFVAYEFFRIPNVLGTGSSFHLGNTFTALTALMLDGVSGGLAGAIGLALADIMAGDPGYAITTFILKFIIGIVCGVFAQKVFKLQDLSAADGVKYYVAVIGSAFSGLLVNVFTDPFLGYFRNRYIFGQEHPVRVSRRPAASGRAPRSGRRQPWGRAAVYAAADGGGQRLYPAAGPGSAGSAYCSCRLRHPQPRL